MEGKRCYEVYRGRSEPCPACPTLRALETGKVEKAEAPLIGKQGVTGALELFAYPISDDTGKLTGVIEYARNITEHKKIERELRFQIKNLMETNTALKNLLSYREKTEKDAEIQNAGSVEQGETIGKIVQPLHSSKDDMESHGNVVREKNAQDISFIETVDFSIIEILDEAYFKIVDANESELESVDRSNGFDEWKILLESVADKGENLTTKHRKILGALITATRQRDVSDFNTRSLGLLKKATSILRQPRVTEKESKNVIAELIENGLRIAIPLAPDNLGEDTIKNLDKMMADLIARSDSRK